jgi:hypothetical protein
MPDPTHPTLDVPSTGEPMTNQAQLFTDPNDHGAPMPDPIDPSTEATAHGEPMTDQTHLFPQPSESQRELMTNDEEAMADTQRMLTPEDAARATLSGLACELGHDEVRVLTRIAQRLRGGRDTYGPLDLSVDTRTFRGKEAREEIEDALVYLACAWLQDQEVA